MTFELSPPKAIHRQYPPPQSPWALQIVCGDLLFEHWRVRPDLLRPLIPAQLELETYDSWAWIGVVPFLMTDVHPRALPPVPWLSEFPELNVRTYVRFAGKP